CERSRDPGAASGDDRSLLRQVQHRAGDRVEVGPSPGTGADERRRAKENPVRSLDRPGLSENGGRGWD
ncbi:MAG: hypothetical protein ACTHMG_15115, partial [Sphingomonas sp.]